MRRTVFRLLACSLSIGTPAAVLSAQPETQSIGVAPPFHVAYVEGSATLVRAGEALVVATGEPLVDGDRLQTATGRLELRGPDGERVFLDQGSTLDVLQAPVFRLLTGAVRVVIDTTANADGAPVVELDTPHGTAALFEAGDYRLSVLRRSGAEETELIVRAGRAEMINTYARVPVAARQRVAVSAYAAPSPPETLAAGDLVDSFDRWVDQALGVTAPTTSAAYLPTGLASYSAALDAAGSWSYEPAYGHVWYPTVVASWQPYYYGFWRPLGYYGYTWVAHTPWAWATHHYGRWDFGAGGWFWIPGVTWGAAWVSWGVGPGYVAWCPLGWGNRPVHPAPFGRHDGRPAPYRGHAPRGHARAASGWTALRADDFRAGRPASRHAVDWRSIGSTEHAAFVEQQVAPRVHLAVPRGTLTASARSLGAGSRSVGVRDGGGAPIAGRFDAARPVTSTGRSPNRAQPSAGTRSAWTSSSSYGRVPTTGRAQARDPGVVGRDAAGVASPRASTSQSSARPRWTPPPTHYGIPAAQTAEPAAEAAPPLGRSRADVTRVSPGYGSVRPRLYGGVDRPVSSPGYAPPVVSRGPRAAAPRGPTSDGPSVRSVSPRTPGGVPPAGAAGRAPSGSAGPARGHAVPRGGAPPRPRGR